MIPTNFNAQMEQTSAGQIVIREGWQCESPWLVEIRAVSPDERATQCLREIFEKLRSAK